jgi:hypothetical protein
LSQLNISLESVSLENEFASGAKVTISVKKGLESVLRRKQLGPSCGKSLVDKPGLFGCSLS